MIMMGNSIRQIWVNVGNFDGKNEIIIMASLFVYFSDYILQLRKSANGTCTEVRCMCLQPVDM